MTTSLSRRGALKALGLFGSAIAGATAVPALAAQKLTKTVAKYQDKPKGIQHCSICLQFEPPESCKLVAGKISPNGWCQFFAAKENAG
jgi:hypothetical protein